MAVESFLTQERSTPTFSTTLVDVNGAVVNGAFLDEVFLTLYDQDTLAILNSRNHVDVLLSGDVAVNASGVLTWVMDEADNAILDATMVEELHEALFEVRWAVGGIPRVIYEEVVIIVKNLAFVPTA